MMLPVTRHSGLERYINTHIVAVGLVEFGVAGMTQREEYLLRAAELSTKAQAERDNIRKLEIENLARAYLRLAKQAERNSQTNTLHETPPNEHDQSYRSQSRNGALLRGFGNFT